MIKLENYKIIKKIASGGMGDVYLAEHTVLENKVAIKSLHSSLVNDEEFRKRFRTEAKTQWKLAHPNIVKLIDFQERKDGLFLIMEYVEGKQLNDYISKVTGPIPDKDLFPLFIQILSAIKYAHSKKLIHRDIKPSNILITPEGNAKVIDFGIAKSGEEDNGLTKAGVQVGTASYMSPEQVNAEKLDNLTDIYSLGVTLFQMAVGQGPYAKETNTFKIQTSIVSDPLPNPKDIYPSISEKLVRIIEKSTQKKKKDRYQNCEEFIKSFDKEYIPEKVSTTKKKVVSEKTREIKQEPKKSIKSKKKVPVFVYVILVLIITGFGYQYYVSNTMLEDETSFDDGQLKLAEGEEEVDVVTYESPDGTIFTEAEAIETYGDVFQSLVDDGQLKRNNKLKTEIYLINRQNELLKLDNEREIKIIEDRKLAKLENQRLDKQEKDKQAKLAKQRLDKKEKDKQAKLVKQRLQKQRLDKIENDKSLVTDENKIYTKYYGKNKYVGKIKNGEPNGEGKITYADGNSYEGNFINGVKNGYGTFKWSDGEVYVGNWKNNRKSGQGSYRYSDGEVWTGNWKDDKQDQKVKSDEAGFKTISAVVRNYNGILSGAGVRIEGGSNGTVTNYSGSFSIKAKPGQVLVISYKGYKDYRYIVQGNVSTFSPILIKR